jgi:hypothetical protein
MMTLETLFMASYTLCVTYKTFVILCVFKELSLLLSFLIINSTVCVCVSKVPKLGKQKKTLSRV